MAEILPQEDQLAPRDAANWAKPVSRLKVSDVPDGALNLNLEGRQVVGALQGFGQLWQKTYRIRLEGTPVTPAEVVAVWKAEFPEFQPPENHFYPSLAGIKPGEVVFIDSTLPIVPTLPGVIPVASGVMVLYADDESFTVMTPEGFPVSGWNTFSAHEEDGAVIAQVQSIERATDPIYEFGFRFMGGARQQEKIWTHVLKSLSGRFGVSGQEVTLDRVCIDGRVQWSQARNIWQNASIRTVFYKMAAPLRWVRALSGQGAEGL